jgi:DNA-binding beta-propeller fold protein YncE
VYVSDSSNHRVQKFDGAGGFLLQWGNSGAGTGQFSFPRHVATDSVGNVYVADTNNHRIQKFTSTGVFVTQWGSFGSGPGQFSSPVGIAVDFTCTPSPCTPTDNVYVADQGNNRIQKFTSAGVFIMQWGVFGGGTGQFNSPAEAGF